MSVRLLHGDCRAVLDTLPEGSVQCCVTSPPYWGLRSYLDAADPLKVHEIGSEPTVDEWVDVMVDVFRRVRRVLRDDGVLFLNLGDSYAGSGRGGEYPGSTLNGRQSNHARDARQQFTAAQKNASAEAGRRRELAGYKPKDLIGQPWLVAFALRADGWWLRQEIIWHKQNPMPESCRDRCTKAHEHIFLLTKSERYFWNFEATQEPVNGGAHARRPREYSGAKRPGFGHGYDEKPKGRYRTDEGWIDRVPAGWDTGPGSHRHKAGRYAEGEGVGQRQGPPGNPAPSRKLAEPGQGIKNNTTFEAVSAGDLRDKRNPRSVWTFPTEAFRGAHFATFPTELARRCITAGTREGDLVLDPFGGSGTVGLVADQMHRDAVLIDLDRRNLPMAQERISADAPLFAETHWVSADEPNGVPG